jgi:hypothetical protein
MDINLHHRLFSFVIIIAITILFTPILTFAQAAPLPFTPLVSIPGLQNATDLNAYINALYSLSISIAALIAVVKIVLAGAKYMLDDLVSGKQQAKTDIWNALIGLLIIIGAWLILNTINSDLTNPSILIERVDMTTTPNQVTETSNSIEQTICGFAAGCTKLICGQIDEWSSEQPGFNIEQSDDCQTRCDFLGGEIVNISEIGLINRQCIVSNATLATIKADEQALLETACTAGNNYTCSVKICTESSGCKSWCELPIAEGGRSGTYNDETLSCVTQFKFTDEPITCSTQSEYGLSCQEIEARCRAHPDYVSVQQTNPTTIICTIVNP